jgi:hypothetical protein
MLKFLHISLLACTSVASRSAPQGEASEQLVNGFAREKSGQQIGYHSFHPYASAAILTRCTDGKQTISWESDPVPANPESPFVTFVWIAGHSTGSSHADATFRLALNGKECLSFPTVRDRRVWQWRVSGTDSVQLSFDARWEDSAHDLFGFIFLKVPVRRFPAGRPLLISVTGDSTGQPDWYMTFTHAFRDSLSVQPQPALIRRPGGTGQAPGQLVDVMIDHLGLTGSAELLLPGRQPVTAPLTLGFNRIPLLVDPVSRRVESRVTVKLHGLPAREFPLTLDPVRPTEFWLLPHSHNDIGYSDLQADVEKKQLKNLRDAMRLFRETGSYPEEARFRWNTEILWAVESFLSTCTPDERREFGEAVRQGGLGLNALYSNQLTGICRPEELLRLTDYSRKLARELHVTLDDAMITDIPGATWAMIAALHQAGIKYFSSGPNLMPFTPILGDRVGHFNLTWGDKPFYWIPPSGKGKVLFWTAGKGYSWFADWILGRVGPMTASHLFDYIRELENQHYPYDMVQLRYTVAGDNGPVDPDLPAFVKAWNEQYVSPRLVIATSSHMFHEFERRWGTSLPTYGGDITPYWEDGALSTLRELGIVRRASEVLVQTEALACIRPEARLSRDSLYAAWRNVTLFDEHTWGAHNSIGEPESPFVISQWLVKRQYALDAERLSAGLISSLLSPDVGGTEIEVINTLSWRRSGLVTLSAAQSKAGDLVLDDGGKAVPSQRLSSGELAFLAREVPQMGGKRFTIRAGKAAPSGDVVAAGTELKNSMVAVSLDPASGAIRSMKSMGGHELAETSSGGGLNQYLYVAGFDPAGAKGAGSSEIEVVEHGPLVGKLRSTSYAPGARSLVREITLVHGSSTVEILDTIDKLPIRTKEGVHVAFPLNVPDGAIRMDGGWGLVRPELDQLPGSCKDYFSSGRWIDMSNNDFGVTLTLLESPLVELGMMTDETPSSKLYRTWRTKVAPGKTIYSYAMNNYWHTNSAASQDGPAPLHFALVPHGAFDAAAAYRTGVEQSQPLLVRQASPSERATAPLFRIGSPEVVVTSLKPSQDGKAVMVRLYNAGEKPVSFGMTWLGFKPKKVLVSSLDEATGTPAGARIPLPKFGILTIRCER